MRRLKFLRIDADVNETFKETEEDRRGREGAGRRRTQRALAEVFKKALGNDKLEREGREAEE